MTAAVAAAIGVLAAPGCYGRECDGSFGTFGSLPNEGHLLDPNTWESNAVDAPWLSFEGSRTWEFDLRALGDRTPHLVIPYLSGSPNPLKENKNFTVGSGNVAVILGSTFGRVYINNATCADYFLRLVVVAPPYPPGPMSIDAGSDASVDADGGAPPSLDSHATSLHSLPSLPGSGPP